MDSRQILADKNFFTTLPEAHKAALNALKDIVDNFLGNVKAPNYVQLAEKLLLEYKKIGALMSLKMHFLMSHIQEFADNLGAFSDQHGERFHQDIKIMENRYKGKDYRNMLGDHCWHLIREDPGACWNRKAKLNYFNKQNIK